MPKLCKSYQLRTIVRMDGTTLKEEEFRFSRKSQGKIKTVQNKTGIDTNLVLTM